MDAFPEAERAEVAPHLLFRRETRVGGLPSS